MCIEINTIEFDLSQIITKSGTYDSRRKVSSSKSVGTISIMIITSWLDLV